ncbi:MAG: hypothetical protein QF464_24120 [Myxococcota bacterium]|nr:hypothetical protein [Myxococcota bacterium]
MVKYSLPRLVSSQLAVSACLGGLLGWGAATAACVPSLLEMLGPGAWFDVVTLAALMGLYFAVVLFIVALAACLLGYLPLYLLAQIAGWMLPSGWRRVLWVLYLCPLLAYGLVVTWSPVWTAQAELATWIGGLFAAIPTLVLVFFHLWVVAPSARTGDRHLSEISPRVEFGLTVVGGERQEPALP